MKHTTTFRQKDSGWQLIISFKDADGKWHQKSRQGFQRKSDAKEAEAELLAQIKKAPRPVEKAMAGITLREFCIEYLKTRKDLVYITKKHYTNAVDAVPDLADKPLAHGMDVQTVAALLGDSVTTVIRTYIHYSDQMRKAAAKNIDRIFNAI